MASGWIAQVLDRTGAARDFITPRNLRITRRLNGASEATFDLDFADDEPPDVKSGSRIVALYRDGTIRFCGPVVGRTLTGGPPGGRAMAITARDPFAVLERRYLEAETTYSSTDAGTIATSLLAVANAQEETHLENGTIDTSVNRDRTYDRGKQIGEAIVQLAEVNNGFWFRIDPEINGDKFGTLEIEYSASGSDQPDVQFAFGTGSFDNLESYSVAEELPTNDVLALGATDTDGEQLIATDDDATSISTYGQWGAVISHVDVSEQATLDAHATDALEAEPYTVYGATPLTSDLSDSAFAPRLWSDFDVGDIVRLSILGGGVDVDGVSVRVLSATVAVSDDGQIETLTNLELEPT